MKPEDAVQEIIDKHNFVPGRKYNLYRLKEIDTRNGGTLEVKKTIPRRNFVLKRDPNFETGLYDLRDEDDFKRFFEKEFGNLPNGKYMSGTSRGGNDGMAYFFRLRLENGKIVNWWSKSKATNQSLNSSTYYVLPDYFRLREELGV